MKHILFAFFVVLLHPKTKTMMKNCVYILLSLLTMVGCAGRKGEGHPAGADSLYTYTYIFLHHIQEPERCLSLIDTAEQRGLMSTDSCNWLRGQICYACLNNQADADEYLRRVLDRPELDHASDVYLTALSTYCTFSLQSCDYIRTLEHATEGARLAHEAGNVRFEAEFYGVAGAAIEHKRPGAGIDYLDRAISLICQQDDRQLLPKASYYLSEKTRIQIEQEQYAEAATTCRERLALIDEMQQVDVFVTEGYLDMQLARTYAKLALCLQSMGQTAEARRAADAFGKTDFAKTMKGKHDIMHYYVMTDDRQHVEQLFRELEEHYQKGDTIDENFRSIILEEAKWYHHHGEWLKTAQALARATELHDSLILRDNNRQTAEFEVQFKTQEKERALAEAEAQARLHFIIIIALVIILVGGAIALWRIIVAQRHLHQKNRDLFELLNRTFPIGDVKSLTTEPTPTAEEKSINSLYSRVCEFMREQQPYTDSDLNRDTLAQMLGTNYSYLADAIRQCTGGHTLSDFLDEYRVKHAARLLANTDTPIGLVIEMSGFASRSHFNTLFREKYKMTPSEYRNVAKEKAYVDNPGEVTPMNPRKVNAQS